MVQEIDLKKKYPNILQYVKDNQCSFEEAIKQLEKSKITGYIQ